MKKMMLTHDDSKLHYEVIGQGEPLIMLHGNSQTSRYFQGQVKDFAAHYQLFLLNTRDHGKSVNSQRELNFDLLSSDLAQLMLIENLPQANIVGFSDGANYALTFASQFPEKVAHLVLISPNLKMKHLKKIYTYPSLVFQKVLDHLPFHKKKRVLNLALTDLPVEPEMLAHVTSPVLVVGGSYDIVSLDRFHELTALFPQGQFALAERTGHSIPRFRRKWLNNTILDFLQPKNDPVS